MRAGSACQPACACGSSASIAPPSSGPTPGGSAFAGSAASTAWASAVSRRLAAWAASVHAEILRLGIESNCHAVVPAVERRNPHRVGCERARPERSSRARDGKLAQHLRRAARGIAIRRAAAGRDGDARGRGTGWDHPGGGAGATPSAACATQRSEISSLEVSDRLESPSDGRGGRPPVAPRRLSKERSLREAKLP